MEQYYIIDPKTYDDQFWWKKDDIEFWKNILLHPQKKVLELAAGTGRLAKPLLREKSMYKGLELSHEYVDFANSKFPTDLNPIIQGDMRLFNLEKKYDFIFIGFNSLLHLIRDDEIINCLSSIKNHMHYGTKLYIDIFMPDPNFLYRSAESNFIMEFFDTKEHCNSRIDETIFYNDIDEFVSVEWSYLKVDTNVLYNTFKFQMRVLYPDTVNRLLVDNGFRICSAWGSYDFEKISEDSSVQVYELELI